MLTASPDRAFVDGLRPGETGRVTFTLSNPTPTTLTILGVERSCACVVTTDLRGKRLEPGEECRLEMVMTIPERGLEKQQIDVVHDSLLSPLRLTIEVLGRKRLPYIVNTPIRQVSFFAIDSAAATATFTLVACEQREAKPWARALTCDLPEVRVEPVKVLEVASGSAVIRTYQYRVGWNKLPSGSEFHGKLLLDVTDPGEPPIPVGSVVGTRAAEASAARE